MSKMYASKIQGENEVCNKRTNFLLSDKYIGNINTKLLKSIPCNLRITKNHTWIPQGALDLGFSFQHVPLGGISSFVLALLTL